MDRQVESQYVDFFIYKIYSLFCYDSFYYDIVEPDICYSSFYTKDEHKTIFTIVAIVAAIGMLSIAAVAVPSVPQAHANKGGGGNPGGTTHNGNQATPKCGQPNNGEPCNGG